MQVTDFTPCMFFFRPAGRKKNQQKEEKYHAAAGYTRACVSPSCRSSWVC